VSAMPPTERELFTRDLGYFTYRPVSGRPAGLLPGTAQELVDGGWLEPEPIVYEDFLPRSAAGIFASNLTDGGEMDAAQGGAERDAAWLAERLGRPVFTPEELYRAESERSLAAAQRSPGV